MDLRFANQDPTAEYLKVREGEPDRKASGAPREVAEQVATRMPQLQGETMGSDASQLIEVKVQSLGLDRSSNTPVVILQELGGERVLPIWIGPGEASAIAMQLADMKFSRPLTHDLLMSVLSGLGGDLERVVITRVADNTYYAELVIRRHEEVITVDARPSDSIAVALRSNARIFAHQDLLERASIEIAEGEEAEDFHAQAEEGEEEGSLMSPEELKEYLRKLNPEDFGRFSP